MTNKKCLKDQHKIKTNQCFIYMPEFLLFLPSSKVIFLYFQPT